MNNHSDNRTILAYKEAVTAIGYRVMMKSNRSTKCDQKVFEAGDVFTMTEV